MMGAAMIAFASAVLGYWQWVADSLRWRLAAVGWV